LTPDIQKEHAVESYKSLISISVEGFKFLALLNGGAAVAVLAYLGNCVAKGCRPPDMRIPLGLFLAGLFLCGLTFLASYQTQLRLYNESLGRAAENSHRPWLRGAMLLASLSLLAFAAGSACGVLRLSN
jgi:hypothetical protein